MYWKVNRRAVAEGGGYSELKHDLNWYHPSAFFNLSGEVMKKPNIRLLKRRREHKVGVLSFLFKHKYWAKIVEGGVCWEDLRFRPICSYLHNVWCRWYSHTGKTCSALAKIIYHSGDGVEAGRGVIRRLARSERLPGPHWDADSDGEATGEGGEWT